MEEKKIAITDSMPDELKAAINYLNENNIGLTDTIVGADDSLDDILDVSDGNFFLSTEPVDDSEISDDLATGGLDGIGQIFDDCVEDDDVNLSDLDDIF